MNLLSICDNGDILSIMRIIKIAILIIRIIVPILLIVSLALNYMNAVKSNDADMLSKANKSSIPKIIAAILVFMIPTFVHLLANLIGDDSYVHCIDIATVENINSAFETSARTSIKRAKETLTTIDYNAALSQINKIKDQDIRNALLSELESIKEYTDINQSINKLKQKYDEKLYNEVLDKINSIKDETIKQKLLKLLSEVNKTQDDTSTPTSYGDPLNVESSFKKVNDNTYPGLSGYYLYIPKNATENMPLVVIFPPNSLSGANMKSIAEAKSLDNFKGFIYIPLIASSERKDWNTSLSNAAVKKINDLVSEYKLDSSRISLTAFSSSGWYIYQTANDHRIFSAIAPISSGMGIDTIKNYYKDWEYLKTLPMKGYGEKGGPTTESGRSCANKTVSWSAKNAMCSVFEGLGKCSDCTNCEYFTYLPEVCHGEIGQYVFSIDNNNNNISDILEWMISQRK